MSTTLTKYSQHLYQNLCIQDFSSIETVRAAYKMMALRCHPDKNLDDPNSANKFREVQIAYDVLSNEERKKTYDAELHHFKSAKVLGGLAPGKSGHRNHGPKGDAVDLSQGTEEHPSPSSPGLDFHLNFSINEELHRYRASRTSFASTRANSSHPLGYKVDPATSSYTQAQQEMFRRRERERQAELRKQLERERRERREREREQRRREQERREEQLQRQWSQQQKCFMAGPSLRRPRGPVAPSVVLPTSRGCTPHPDLPEALRVTTPRSGLSGLSSHSHGLGLGRPSSAGGSLRPVHVRPTVDLARTTAAVTATPRGVARRLAPASPRDRVRPRPTSAPPYRPHVQADSAGPGQEGDAGGGHETEKAKEEEGRRGPCSHGPRLEPNSSRAERLERLRQQQAKARAEQDAEARANPTVFFTRQLSMTVADERSEREQLIEKEEALAWCRLLRQSQTILNELICNQYVRKALQKKAIQCEILFQHAIKEYTMPVCMAKELLERRKLEIFERKARKALAGREANALYYVIRNIKTMKSLLAQEAPERRRLQELEQFRSRYLFKVVFPEISERIHLREVESRMRCNIIRRARDSIPSSSPLKRAVGANPSVHLPPRECASPCSDTQSLSTNGSTANASNISPHARSSAALNTIAAVTTTAVNELIVGSRENRSGVEISSLDNVPLTMLSEQRCTRLLSVERRVRANLEDIYDGEFLRIIRLRANTIHHCYRREIQAVARRVLQTSQEEVRALRKHIASLEARLKEPFRQVPSDTLKLF
ncbi:unnamed protein product [Phytomonas sp. Hart1]|nr:unnamed protein product [Phytomonas sp. Hart1]|eukprot:CCW69586.1 unnamed protein product [Phytomonas sp. isolate Hart1]